MKNLLLVLVSTILFISCESELDIKDPVQETSEKSANLSKANLESIIASDFSSQKFGGNRVAYAVNDEIKLGVSHEELLSSFNNNSKKLKLDRTALSLQILKIDNESYIRFNNDDESVSTVALLRDSNKGFEEIMVIGTTVCTSSKCSSCCGCLPNGDYCTICNIGTTNDCKRSTSSGPGLSD